MIALGDGFLPVRPESFPARIVEQIQNLGAEIVGIPAAKHLAALRIVDDSFQRRTVRDYHGLSEGHVVEYLVRYRSFGVLALQVRDKTNRALGNKTRTAIELQPAGK